MNDDGLHVRRDLYALMPKAEKTDNSTKNKSPDSLEDKGCGLLIWTSAKRAWCPRTQINPNLNLSFTTKPLTIGVVINKLCLLT